MINIRRWLEGHTLSQQAHSRLNGRFCCHRPTILVSSMLTWGAIVATFTACFRANVRVMSSVLHSTLGYIGHSRSCFLQHCSGGFGMQAFKPGPHLCLGELQMHSSAECTCLRLADRTSSLLLGDRVQQRLPSSASGMLTRYGAFCLPCTSYHSPSRAAKHRALYDSNLISRAVRLGGACRNYPEGVKADAC